MVGYLLSRKWNANFTIIFQCSYGLVGMHMHLYGHVVCVFFNANHFWVWIRFNYVNLGQELYRRIVVEAVRSWPGLFLLPIRFQFMWNMLPLLTGLIFIKIWSLCNFRFLKRPIDYIILAIWKLNCVNNGMSNVEIFLKWLFLFGW